MMGVSTDAKIFWGFELPEDSGLEWLADWELQYAIEVAGLKEPTVDYDANPKVHHAFWVARNEAISHCISRIGRHCSGDYPIYYACIKVSEVVANRGFAVTLSGELEVRSHWEVTLQEFCKAMGIEWQEPDWYLASWFD